MKIIKRMMIGTFCTFFILSLLVGILCKANILKSLPYSDAVFPLLFMSIGTTLFVTVRELLLPNSTIINSCIDLFGCSAVILLIGHLVGWLEVSLSYFLLICGMVLTVYLSVWFITWLQSKHDEEDLNRLLTGRFDERKNQEN